MYASDGCQLPFSTFNSKCRRLLLLQEWEGFSSIAGHVCNLFSPLSSHQVLSAAGAPVPGPSSDAPAAGLNYVQAEAGSCSQACKNSGYSQAYYFASSFVPSDPPMYACSVSTPAEGPTPAGVLAGYQANDTATCTVVQGDEVVVAHDFSCLCQVSAAFELQWQLRSNVLFFRQMLTPHLMCRTQTTFRGLTIQPLPAVLVAARRSLAARASHC